MKKSLLQLLMVVCAGLFLSSPNPARAQLSTFVTQANLGPCPPPCPPPAIIKNPVFQTVFVFNPNNPGETWDQHLTAFISQSPQFGPPSCMDGTAFPCLQGLTSESINNFVQALFNSNYFQSMESNYGPSPPKFAGELPMPPCALGLSTDFPHTASLVNCLSLLSSGTGAPNQFILIFAPDLAPATPPDGSAVCPANPPPNTFSATAFHTASVSGVQYWSARSFVPLEELV